MWPVETNAKFSMQPVKLRENPEFVALDAYGPALRRTLPDNDVPWLLLERYYAGKCTPEERTELEAWLAEDPRRRLLVERLRTSLGEQSPTPDQADIERAWSRLTSAIDRNRSRRRTILPLLVVSLLVLLGVVWFVARHVKY